MTTEYLYPLDLTGSQPSNLIRDEKHTISPPSQITQSSFIVLRACPFFAHNIVVKDGKGATARTLVFGEDYLLTHKSIALTMLTKKAVYASIMFKDRNYTGTVYVTYQTVGGEYNLDDYTIVEKLTRQKYTITHVSFDQIVGLPASFPNPPHQHDPTDLVGMSQIVEKLSDLAAAIRGNKGSFGVVNATLNAHLIGQTAHTPTQVGLGNVKNYTTAVAADYDKKAADKYATAATVNDYVTKRINESETVYNSRYITKELAGLTYVKAQEVYTKAESDNLYHNKQYLDKIYLKKADAVTPQHVGNIVNDIVNLSQYHTRAEALGVFYTRADADARYYTRSQTDAKFVTQTAGDARYIQTTDPSAILSTRTDNQLLIEDGKFYVGKQAPLNVTDLYIDCINGSDNGTGTRSSPLRTLQRANELTPDNKSSTWRIRSYSTTQMEAANSWYSWDFDHVVKDNAKRHVTVYNNTWIDGAKNSQATQLHDGINNWWNLTQYIPVEVYIRAKPGNGDVAAIYSAVLDDNSSLTFRGITLLKPMATGKVEAITSSYLKRISFMYGTGTFTLIGTRLFQLGEYQGDDTTTFKWYHSDIDHNSRLILDACDYGYAKVMTNINNTATLTPNTSSVFKYTASKTPFHYEYSVGQLMARSSGFIGLGAGGAGGTLASRNIEVVLKRTGMISGLNIVNGVCTNVQSNITLVS